jgi:hypothetical protein
MEDWPLSNECPKYHNTYDEAHHLGRLLLEAHDLACGRERILLIGIDRFGRDDHKDRVDQQKYQQQ